MRAPPAIELLTAAQAADLDRAAAQRHGGNLITLIERAGRAVAETILGKYPGSAKIAVLCGPGNNGADGFVAARLLAESGLQIELWVEGEPFLDTDAAFVARACPVPRLPLREFQLTRQSVVVDALYGAGLARPLGPDGSRAALLCADAGVPVLSVDLPSGVHGDTGRPLGPSFRASLTLTFARMKPGHLLQPGRSLCGEVIVADIGIDNDMLEALAVTLFRNDPVLWQRSLPLLDRDVHKYSRGHVGVFGGGASSSGAARLAAMAAARAGAGAVTLLSPREALAANASHLTSTILRAVDTLDEALQFIAERKPQALVFGPGRGLGSAPTIEPFDLLSVSESQDRVVVLDADGLTMLAGDVGRCFEAACSASAPALVLTPHEGEFRRLFPDLANSEAGSKVDRARAAAARAGAVLVYKGPDTVIASPDGRAAINANGTALLATAGSGDVLSGIIAGLAAQSMPPFEAACAAVWMHAAAARRVGPGLIAEDLPQALMPVLRDFMAVDPA